MQEIASGIAAGSSCIYAELCQGTPEGIIPVKYALGHARSNINYRRLIETSLANVRTTRNTIEQPHTLEQPDSGDRY